MKKILILLNKTLLIFSTTFFIKADQLLYLKPRNFEHEKITFTVRLSPNPPNQFGEFNDIELKNKDYIQMHNSYSVNLTELQEKSGKKFKSFQLLGLGEPCKHSVHVPESDIGSTVEDYMDYNCISSDVKPIEGSQTFIVGLNGGKLSALKK